MKRLLKKVLKALWRATSPVRRPIVRKLDGHLARVQVEVIRGEILPPIVHRVDASIEATNHLAGALTHQVGSLVGQTHALNNEMNLVLNSVVRELARLEMQVEVLQQVVLEAARSRGGLSLVDPAAEEADEFAAEQRMKVG